ncbi:integrin beta-nu-like [Hyposmocoma kahamanoa]|uniref:integrin beta-nu-like n=1 Tax=Hyposmocoma kahamanoa TaxID=1477025 RepID=UPI000E6D7D3A|nr:integrin beta-nu-like [Hyposmocoma kahamanoa]
MYKILFCTTSIVVNLCLFCIGYVAGQVQLQQVQNKLVCIELEECGKCLSAASHCRWCADPYFKAPSTRCDDEKSLVLAGCSQAAIQRPEAPVWNVTDNRPLQDVPTGSSEVDKAVQIQPQKVHLSLKPRQTVKVKFSYRPARNYPLELYYLMDLTYSMLDDKETLVSLRDDLPPMLKNLTANFKIGFGSFLEKPLMPFIHMDQKRRKNPCAVYDQVCSPTYTYKHHLSITDKVEEFIASVNQSSVSANVDNAEAQLDALVQVLTCGEKIGWAEHSRKIVLILTDGVLHWAGDGRLGGATMKNDEKCHLDEDGYYSDSVIYDYPTIAQIHRLLGKYKVNVIFAITQEQKSHYDSLHELLGDFTYVAKLESDSSNILKVVKTGYEDIVSVVDFQDDAKKGPIKVKYFTDCGVEGAPMIEATKCTGVEHGMTLNYEAHLTLDHCPTYDKSTQTILITESQLGQDSMTLTVDLQCGCDCKAESPSLMSHTCGPKRHLVCGACLCNPGWSGPNCDCSTEDEAASAALIAKCRDANATRSVPCSGVGECICGECDCDEGYNGKYCQCEDCGIAKDNELECGGLERGVCACGKCSCESGWTGDTCSCPLDNDTCIAPEAEQICSGRGVCVCGVCECSSVDNDDNKYTGQYCEVCTTCKDPMCATTESCVWCHLNNTCTDMCSNEGYNYTVSNRMMELGDYNITESDEDPKSMPCIFRVEDDNQECQYYYTYTPANKSTIAMDVVIHSKTCVQPTSATIMTSALAIIICILLAGIICILFVKTAHIISDRRAYAKFIQEAEESKQNMQELNPLYISPISVFRLPESFPRDKTD